MVWKVLLGWEFRDIPSHVKWVLRSVFFVNCYRRDHFLISQLSHFRVQININIAKLSENTLSGRKTPLWGLWSDDTRIKKLFLLFFPPLLLCPARAARRNFRFFPGIFLLKLSRNEVRSVWKFEKWLENKITGHFSKGSKPYNIGPKTLILWLISWKSVHHSLFSSFCSPEMKKNA